VSLVPRRIGNEKDEEKGAGLWGLPLGAVVLKGECVSYTRHLPPSEMEVREG
jgi:hypothetical protein